MPEPTPLHPETWSLPAKQARSRDTRDRLVASGLRLLQVTDFDNLKIADIAADAGCSVGSFYWRFESKDTFFRALIEVFQQERLQSALLLYEGATLENVVTRLLERERSLIEDYGNLWRAAIVRGANDPAFWEEVRQRGEFAIGRFLVWYSSEFDRQLCEDEERNIRFAFRMVRSTINNYVLSEWVPGQEFPQSFFSQLERAFRLLCGISEPRQSARRV